MFGKVESLSDAKNRAAAIQVVDAKGIERARLLLEGIPWVLRAGAWWDKFLRGRPAETNLLYPFLGVEPPI